MKSTQSNHRQSIKLVHTSSAQESSLTDLFASVKNWLKVIISLPGDNLPCIFLLGPGVMTL